MAQAARLSLRMQKELKLLLADPPPRASFPFLSPTSSSDHHLSSLSTILAQIEGPEGSVYADGVFKIKIQIPERYPFQPPGVTFQTPIYHPNIDTGGRICLDILNLPPKGAWQPSLNISTVLTSIGLLLSEPNPDDGLMCDASREYKYNRQAFDEKARYMTQKYAKAGASGSICDNPSMELNSSPSSMEGDRSMKETQDRVNEFEPVKKNLSGFTRKLSLICSSSNQRKDGDGEVNDKCNPWESASNNENCLDVDKTRDEQAVREGSNHQTPDGMGLIPLLALREDVLRDNHDRDKEGVAPHYQSLSPHSLLRTSDSFVVQSQKHLDQSNTSEKEIVDCTLEKPFSEQMHPSTASGSCQLVSGIEAEMLKMPRLLPSIVLDNSLKGSTEMPRKGRQAEVDSQNDLSGDNCDGSAGTKRKKLCLGGRQLSLGLKGSYQKGDAEAKENFGPTGKVELSGPHDPSMKSVAGQKSSLGPLAQPRESDKRNSQFSCSTAVSKDCFDSKPVKPDHGRRMKRLGRDRNVKYAEEINEKGPKELPTPDSVIVLDSEDSEDEGKASLMGKSVLARKRIAKAKLRA
ncbi:uncharacterized protein LOC115690420 isoform X2 [Syzygium oleosum]|uniref:uncharacterized protein LOC115690420 isoform X2 n=1 Tax=Syzygium oleosum TaxID=219896 RepID=UPI0024BBA119|nr:uncharacterized protein LOC115690420 isoform X2 [Syzygium oleosum]